MALSDGDRIRNLLGRYGDLMDAGRLDEVGELFASAALVDDAGTVLARGAAEVADYYERIVRRYDGGGLRTKHLVANTMLEEVGPDRIVARSSYLVLQATEHLPLQPIITGRYVDTFERADDAWRWIERGFVVDQLGDLGHHLTLDLG